MQAKREFITKVLGDVLTKIAIACIHEETQRVGIVASIGAKHDPSGFNMAATHIHICMELQLHQCALSITPPYAKVCKAFEAVQSRAQCTESCVAFHFASIGLSNISGRSRVLV